MSRKNEEPIEVDAFYDSISKSYTDSIQRCVPQYTEMLKSLFIYINPEFSPTTILELGCGTGNLTQLIQHRYPDATITAVDISPECINECKSRVNPKNIIYTQSDFKDIDFPENSFDLIVSSISIHHIPDVDKSELFRKLYYYQTKGGILSFCDQFRGETDYIYAKHIEQWKNFAMTQNNNENEWNMWMKHQQEHDYHTTLENHLGWIRSVGYKLVDCTRKHLLWTSIYAEK